MGKTEKAPTEPVSLSDVWNNVKPKWVEFVDWTLNPDDEFHFCVIEFTEDSPTPYKNKWQRDQMKINVKQDGKEKILSGGNRLFAVLKDEILKRNKVLTQWGKIQINRVGSGFETDYQITDV